MKEERRREGKTADLATVSSSSYVKDYADTPMLTKLESRQVFIPLSLVKERRTNDNHEDDDDDVDG